MKVKHDPTSGHFKIVLNDKQSVGGKMVTENCIVDLDENGLVIAIEILDAPKHQIDPVHTEYIDISDPAYRAARASQRHKTE